MTKIPLDFYLSCFNMFTTLLRKMKNYNGILSMLERCSSMRKLKQFHAQLITTAHIRDVIPLSKLIDFCTDPDLGDMDYAESIFLRIVQPSTYIWNSMIRGFSNTNEQRRALSMYQEMQQLGYSPNNFTFPFVLRVCGQILDQNIGKCVHGRITKTGFESDLYVCSGLIQMYVYCYDLEAAEKVFDKMPVRNVVTWSILIAGYVSNGRASKAIGIFKRMELNKIQPNEITMVNVLVACAKSRDLATGTWVHSCIRQIGMDPIHSNSKSNLNSNIILATAILDMYARCGKLKRAQELFEEMPHRNVVSWNAMIDAYNQYGRATEAIRLFNDMQASDVQPDKMTILSLFSACAHVGFLALGQGLHAYVEKTNICNDIATDTALMDMYAKSGDTKTALRVFGSLQRKDVMAWTSMIIGLAMHGHGEEALGLFREMQGDDGVMPDHITYVGVLCACSHAGLVDMGLEHFNSMKSVYGMTPMIEHYGCMVDLLSRAGRLAEAERLVELMPIQPNIPIWGALLSGCEIYGNVRMAERIGNRIHDLNDLGAGVCVLLSNIYAMAGIWQGVQMTRELMRHRGIQKPHGWSSIEVKMLSS